MCEFCHRHGDGKKWYLEARNYSQDLLSDVRRRRFIRDFFGRPEGLSAEASRLDRVSRLPGFVQRMIKAAVTRRMKKQHFGQVLPIEDVEAVFGFVNSIVRVPCICRLATLKREVGYCYGISVGPGDGLGDILRDVDPSFLPGPDSSELDRLTPAEGLEAFAEHEKEGLCHTVWTFGTPFIGGICNCDRSDCMAMQATVVQDTKVMFRAETVAELNPDLCTGCRSCMRVCQFGAIGYSAANKKAYIDQADCYGCGVCRRACSQDAIHLRPRTEVPLVASLW